MVTYGEEARKIIREIIETSERFRKESEEGANNEKGDTVPSILNKRLYLTQTYIESRFEVIFIILQSMMGAINSISTAIDKLPDRQEFNEVKLNYKHRLAKASDRPKRS
jgi:hypothetical protein